MLSEIISLVNSDGFKAFKEVTEVVSFICAPVVLIAAWRALEQVTIGAAQLRQAENSVRIQSLREARRSALERCDEFARELIPMINLLVKSDKYPINKAAKWERKQDQVSVQLQGSKTIQDLLNESTVDDCKLLNVLNRFEGFAMSFVSQVADESIAFRPAAASFCNVVEIFMPTILAYSSTSRLYSNTLNLWVLWRDRLDAEGAAVQLAQLEQQQKVLKEKSANVQLKVIPPLGVQ